ncbi:MAG: Peptidase T [Candidatus Erwinia impunctatus]|nr:Peptidase T [Culicoides impunctatus]
MTHPHIIAITQQAMQLCEITPVMKAIRGGTDGARLSFMGIPCPNLFTGGYNFHSKHEFASLDNMEKAVSVITRIVTLTAEKARGQR